MYLHLLKVKDDKFLIKIPNKVSSAKKFDDRARIKYQQLPDNYFVFDISNFNKDEVDNVIELEIQQ